MPVCVLELWRAVQTVSVVVVIIARYTNNRYCYVRPTARSAGMVCRSSAVVGRSKLATKAPIDTGHTGERQRKAAPRAARPSQSSRCHRGHILLRQNDDRASSLTQTTKLWSSTTVQSDYFTRPTWPTRPTRPARQRRTTLRRRYPHHWVIMTLRKASTLERSSKNPSNSILLFSPYC